ncbi:MAG: glycoside hydrolase family 2 TIM barrel-domain containing protein [Lachnospiraceae bacterium]|nr:glycoside hydrolase family 2 TIM barrel-domain containing protein [Lachnospiraceae bacterium]
MKQLYTPWGENLSQENILQEYPRPALVRDSYINLNGLWDYAFTKDRERPSRFDGTILVPFSPETILSGVNRQLQPEEFLWYRRTIPLDHHKLAAGMGLHLHFGAVDQSVEVYLDGVQIVRHHGGYLPFYLDITSQATLAEKNCLELTLCVKDVSDTSYYARGKQKLHRGGMYYTAQSGIWQTVWMEYVPKEYVSSVHTITNIDEGNISFEINMERVDSIDRQFDAISVPFSLDILPPTMTDAPMAVPVDVLDSMTLHPALCSKTDMLTITDAALCYRVQINLSPEQQSLWTPDTPYLYPYRLRIGEDYVAGYFAMRSFTKEQDEEGIYRICLNHKPIFMRGVLDQGYWPEGLMTPPRDEAFVFDIKEMKKLGYNMIRKHIKIEPQRFYYHCDRLGMIVWQDMVNGGESYKDWYVTYMATAKSLLGIKSRDTNAKLLSRLNAEGKVEWETEMLSTIELLKEHPCISTWVIFNEGWGQFETNRMVSLAREADSTRLIDATSGWYDQGCGDMNSFHNYFFKMKIPKDSYDNTRVAVLSEFGGYSLAIENHCTDDGLYGYGTYKTKEELQKAFEKREAQVQALIPQGLCASVYTQVSDIEDEVNGIFTYDRKVQKIH